MADIDLLFGVAGGGDVAGESGSLIKSQLESIIKGVEPLKIKVGIDIDASKKDFATDVESLFKGVSKTIKLKLDTSDISKPPSGNGGKGDSSILEKDTTSYFRAVTKLEKLQTSVRENLRKWTEAKDGTSASDYRDIERQAKRLQALERLLNTGKLPLSNFEKYVSEISATVAKATDNIHLNEENKRVDADAYAEATKALKEYYKAQTDAVKYRDKISYNSVSNEWETQENNLAGLVKRLNETKKAYIDNIAVVRKFTDENKKSFTDAIAKESREYNEVVQAQRRKDASAAEAKAKSDEKGALNKATEALNKYYKARTDLIKYQDKITYNKSTHEWETQDSNLQALVKRLNEAKVAYAEALKYAQNFSVENKKAFSAEALKEQQKYNEAVQSRARKDADASSSASVKAEKELYDESVASIKKYYKALNELESTKGNDVFLNASGEFESISGKYKELADTANRAKKELDDAKDAITILSDDQQVSFLRELNNELNKFILNQEKRSNASQDAADAENIDRATKAVRAYYDAQKEAIKYRDQIFRDSDTGMWVTEDQSLEALVRRLNETRRAYIDIAKEIGAASDKVKSAFNEEESKSRQAYREVSSAQDRRDKSSADAKAIEDEEKALKKATVALNEYYKAKTEALKFRDEIRQNDDGTWETDDKNLQAFVDRLNSATTAYKQAEEAAERLSAENKDAFSADKAKAVQAYNEAVQAQNRKDIDAGYAKKEADAKRYAAQVEKVNNLLLKTKKQLNDFAAAKTGKSSDSYRGLEQTCNVLEEMAAELRDTGHAVDDLDSRFDDASASAKKFASNIELAGENTKSIKSKLGDLMNTLGFSFTYAEVFQKAIEIGRKMFETVTEVDTAMTELKKVTEEADSTYTRFLENAKSRAHGLGATVADTVSATADFARLGHTLTDATSLADAAIVYKNVGDGIEDISVASESIISTMQAFGVEAKDAMSIVDSFNNVGNNFAISSKGIGDALLNSAASLHAAGNDIHESIALIAAANTTIQDPGKVGKCLPNNAVMHCKKIAISVKGWRQLRPRKDFVVCVRRVRESTDFYYL